MNEHEDLNTFATEREAMARFDPTTPSTDNTTGQICFCDCCRLEREQEQRAYANPASKDGASVNEL